MGCKTTKHVALLKSKDYQKIILLLALVFRPKLSDFPVCPRLIMVSSKYRNNIKSDARLPSRPICAWSKHGHLCYLLPWKDITIYMDVELNPGPDNTTRNHVHSDISALSSQINSSTSISTEEKNLLNSCSGLPSLPLYYSHFTRSTISPTQN